MRPAGVMPAGEFKTFSAEHLVTLCVLGSLYAIVVLARGWLRTARHGRICRIAMGVILFSNEAIYLAVRIATRGFDRQDCLPLHLCDLTLLAVVAALLTKRRFVSEFALFFGLGGSLQALVTPDLARGFPSYAYLKFFASHGGIILAVVYLVAVEGLRPDSGSVRRMIVAGFLYAAVVGALNWLLGTNYGYLCYKPDHPSLLDYLGPWPWYIGSMAGLGILTVLAIYAPFAVASRFGRQRLGSL